MLVSLTPRPASIATAAAAGVQVAILPPFDRTDDREASIETRCRSARTPSYRATPPEKSGRRRFASQALLGRIQGRGLTRRTARHFGPRAVRRGQVKLEEQRTSRTASRQKSESLLIGRIQSQLAPWSANATTTGTTNAGSQRSPQRDRRPSGIHRRAACQPEPSAHPASPRQTVAAESTGRRLCLAWVAAFDRNGWPSSVGIRWRLCLGSATGRPILAGSSLVANDRGRHSVDGGHRVGEPCTGGFRAPSSELGMRLLAISDLHLGDPVNRECFASIGASPDDWLILAGDVGEARNISS
jgi:hypothetical protein